MIGIIKSIKVMNCDICRENIQKGEFKVKDSQDNHRRKYYHLRCFPMNKIMRQLELWMLAQRESMA